MAKDFDLKAYHNGYKERISVLIDTKMKRRGRPGERGKPKKPAAKSMMEMLKETAISRRIFSGSACALVYNTATGHVSYEVLYNPDIPKPLI